MSSANVLWLIALLAVAGPACAADPPERILLNGIVLTMDKTDRVAQAIAIDGNRIVAVGSNAEIKRTAGRRTKIIDVGGRTIIPGLNDTHIHAIRGGQTFTFETYWYDVATLPAALDQLISAARQRGPGKWVSVAGSWSHQQFAEKRAPTVEELNKALPDNPAYIQYLYDYALLNDKGMEALGLNKDGASIPGIEVEKNAQGKPTGKVLGNIGSFSFLFNKVSAAAKDDERKDSLAGYFSVLNSYGVTSLVDAAGGGSGAAVYDPLFALWREGRLPLRVAYRISAQTPGNEAAWYANTLTYFPPRLGDDTLKFLGLGEIVVFRMNDGVRVAPGFAAAEDGKEELYKVAVMAADRKYSLEIHAYTNDAAKQILDVFERVAQTRNLRDLRWCIAHISTATAETFDRMKKLGLCYSVQMGPYYEAFQIAQTNSIAVTDYVTPLKAALNTGLMVIGGTDSTRIGEFNTWRAIEYHVTGRPVGTSTRPRDGKAVHCRQLRAPAGRSIMRTLLPAAVLAAVAQPATVAADPVADFYKGKQVQMVIRTTVGGGYDVASRLLARHIGRFIPGNPSVLPVNMSGGGGIVAANFMGLRAPKDGTAISIISQGLPIDQALGLSKSLQIDLRRLNWIGNMSGSNQVIVTWHTSPTRTLADAIKRPTTIGPGRSITRD